MVSAALLCYLQRVFITRSRSFTFLHHYSTSTQQRQPISVLHNYLVNSIGLSPEAASKKLPRYESFRNDPDLVLHYLKSLGLDNDQNKSMISAIFIFIATEIPTEIEAIEMKVVVVGGGWRREGRRKLGIEVSKYYSNKLSGPVSSIFLVWMVKRVKGILGTTH